MRDKYYASRRIYGRKGSPKIYMHRMILGLTVGDKREGDHKNHDTLDNRRSNLRIAKRGENARNQLRRRDNKSGYKGVTWSKHHKRWRAFIGLGKKRYEWLGNYQTAYQAAAAYNEAAARIYGEYAQLNEIREEQEFWGS
jgi:hypothetical protein